MGPATGRKDRLARCHGITWQTPEAMHELLDSGALSSCRSDGDVVVLNHFMHGVTLNDSAHYDASAREGQLRALVSHARARCGRRVVWRTPNQLDARTREKTSGGAATWGDMVDLDGRLMPRLASDLELPLLGALSVTSSAIGESTDGRHYSRWELGQEAHIFLSQLSCLHRQGFW
jgi:hypothetical protein